MLPGDLGLASTVTVSNVRLTEVAIPEPGSLWLILVGGLGGWLTQRHGRNSWQDAVKDCRLAEQG